VMASIRVADLLTTVLSEGTAQRAGRRAYQVKPEPQRDELIAGANRITVQR